MLTTLLNRILTHEPGLKVAAIVDEFGNLASAKLGYDCMSCRQQVMAMVQSGQLSVT